ncbi:hypothetical protein WMY93_032475 [Mugilogobius chulae]|uniref:Uncharacterized protein n=1 Tax=Mugilogobius chulae TaxID=88201 RepID=A0AAW0MW83_9GOBI
MLDSGEIATTFANFCECIDDENAHIIFTRWLHYVPRLKYGYYVCYSVKLPAQAYPDEWTAVQQGLEAIGGRIYAGCGGNLGAVRSTRFTRITWISKELLVTAGNKTLANYRGGAEDPTMVDHVRIWIREHLAALGGQDLNQEDPSEEETQQFGVMVALARAHPNVAYHLADMDGHQEARVPEPEDIDQGEGVD